MNKCSFILSIAGSMFSIVAFAKSYSVPTNVTLAPVTVNKFILQNEALSYMPIEITKATLPINVKIDAASRTNEYGPITYRSANDTATVTSSFARFSFPTVETPCTKEFLSFFNNVIPAYDFSATDAGAAFFDNYYSSDYSSGYIKMHRLIYATQYEAGKMRVISYFLSLEIFAQDLFPSGQAVPSIDESTLRAILKNANPNSTNLYEEVNSYWELEGSCGPGGCKRHDASGFRVVWGDVSTKNKSTRRNNEIKDENAKETLSCLNNRHSSQASY